MKDRIDPLIADRAAWLFSGKPGTNAARQVLNRALGYRETLALAEHYRDMTPAAIFDHVGQKIARDVEVTGLDNIPATGAGLVVANHPTGIADGIVLASLIAHRRKDAFFYANSDILTVLPQLEDRIVPVEWRMDRRTHAKTRETMRITREAVGDGRLGVIFPSGRLAKRRGLRLTERPWMSSAAMIARKFDLPVIPVNIRARNSVLFYLFDALHPSLRDITLFHETLNKDRQPFRVTVGRPIQPQSLPKDANAAIAQLRHEALRLNPDRLTEVSLVSASRKPSVMVRGTLKKVLGG